MRCAFFGGSFDPPHSGHLHIARAAAERLALDLVLLAPVGRQPLKTEEPTPFADRLRMVELLVAGEPRLAASALDAPRAGPNYTTETLPQVRASLEPDAELFLLAGADSILTLPHWHEPRLLLRARAWGGLLDGWILAARPGFPLESLQRALPSDFTLGPPTGSSGGAASPVTYPVFDEHGRTGTPLHLLTDLDDPATATAIRDALRHGAPTPHLLPSVARYLEDHGLYRVLG